MESSSVSVQSRSPLLPVWLSPVLCGVIVAFFYCWSGGFGPTRTESPLGWLASTWNPENDYEHGFLFPVIIGGLIAFQWKRFRELAVSRPDPWFQLLAWGSIVFGVLLFLSSHRVLQPRVAVGSLPFILWGCSLHFWGWRVARLLLFPFFFILLSVPVPQFQQATTQLQILSTKLAQHGSSACGVETVVRGTQIFSAGDKWAPLQIDEGCGGIRSLMALIMISATWAYLAKMALWKKLCLFAAAFPLAIIGNMLRLISIFVIAEYGNPHFAANTWHDWSGLLLFYPISLVLLLCLHSILEGGLPWKRKRKIERRVISRKEAPVS